MKYYTQWLILHIISKEEQKHPPEMFCEKGVFKKFAQFTRKLLRQSLLACNFIKKETLAQVNFLNFAKFLRTPFLSEHLCHLSEVISLTFKDKHNSLEQLHKFQKQELRKRYFMIKVSLILPKPKEREGI